MKTIYIAVIGPSEPEDHVAETAERAGYLAASAGAVVVTGGRGGVMQAASRGARAAGGTTVGILPGLTRGDANPFVEIAIPTGMGEMRNMLVVRSADGVIAVGKGYGTLSEIGFALRHEKPVVGIDTWRVSLEGVGEGVVPASSPEEAVGMLRSRIPGWGAA